LTMPRWRETSLSCAFLSAAKDLYFLGFLLIL
jgi:hypothetical protein